MAAPDPLENDEGDRLRLDRRRSAAVCGVPGRAPADDDTGRRRRALDAGVERASGMASCLPGGVDVAVLPSAASKSSSMYV